MEMAKSHNTMSFGIMTLILFSMLFAFSVNGMVNDDDTKVDRNSVLKTIVNGDEIIDCVDIYKQPAFNHPLLKNHTLQLKPSSYPTGSKSKIPSNSTKHIQMWRRNGEYCPKGTIPILRSSSTNISPNNTINFGRRSVPESATVFLTGSRYYGLNADISAWSPRIQPNELSSSQVWMTDGAGFNAESMEAGWMVTSQKPNPTIFVHWTVGKHGCYNLDCPGFVQTSSKVGLGTQLQPVSIYGGQQYFINVKIHKDYFTGNWWLSVEGKAIGYWPAILFNNLKPSAKVVEWGGKVINTEPKGFHTTTQMGSGHFPREGYGKAAWFRNLEFADKFGNYWDVGDLITGSATRSNCYDVQIKKWAKNVGTSFLYGGPGFSPVCRK